MRHFIRDRAKRKVPGETGQALVELSLALPLLCIILIGLAEFGRFAYFAVEISNAAHAGAQYGAQNHVTASDSAGMQTAAINDGANVSGLTATATHFCVCADGTASTCSPTDCSGSRIVEFVQVNTGASIGSMFNYPGLSRTLTLTGQAVMRVEQ